MNAVYLKKVEKRDFPIFERIFSNMLKIAKKQESHEVHKKGGAGNRRKAGINQRYLKSLLKEFLDSEKNFMKNARAIRDVFHQLRECYPNEKMIEHYDRHLRIALACFETFHAQFLLIWHACYPDVLRGIEEFTVLYGSAFYNKILSDLSLLYQEFELWGGEFEYERRVVETGLFPNDIIAGVYTEYSPVIFIQRLPQIFMLIEESLKQSSHKNLHFIDEVVRGKLLLHTS